MATLEKIELEILYEISRIANSPLDLKERLNSIVEITSEKMRKDSCSILLLDKEGKRLVLRATKGLNTVAIDKVKVDIGEGVVGWVAREGATVALERASEDPRFKYVPMTGEERFKSMLVVPIMVDENVIGVLMVQTVEPWQYSVDEITLLSTISNGIGGIIRNAQFFQDASQKLSELTALYRIGQALISTLDLPALLNLIVTHSRRVLKARGSVLRLLDPEKNLLSLKAYSGPRNLSEVDTTLRLGEGIAGRVASMGKPINVEDVKKEPDIANKIDAIASSILCVPLISRNKVVGTLSVYDKKTEMGEFTFFIEDDLRLLTTLASQAAVAIENASLYETTKALAQENERRLLGLSVLYDISSAMKTTLELERLLRIILAGVTIGGGLGFNRAMLFLVDEWSNTLQGMLGVGPDSSEEAGIIWKRLGTIESITKWITTEEELTEPRKSHLDEMVKSVRIPILQEACILTQTVIEKKAYNIANAAEDPRVCKTCKNLFGTANFATVPLVAKDKVVGIIVVDNIFNRKPITEEDMDFLSMLASQAGMAIENAMIYTRLEETNRELREVQGRLIQTEKMVALGEMMSRLAHEVRNPLVAVAGFARRLKERTSEDQVQNRYASIILQEADRLEKLLADILTFSREAIPSFEGTDINKIIEETLDLFKEDLAIHNIMIVTEFGDIPSIFVDPQQMKQVFINLFSNAEEAMKDGGELYVSSEVKKEEARPEIVIKVRDTGGGIPLDALSNIFNPFFTTKATGTGLGLSIVHRIIENHRGKIGVENRIGEGVTFIITLPVEELPFGKK